MGRRVNTHLPPRMYAKRQRSGRIYYYLDTSSKPRRPIPLGSDYFEAIAKWTALTQSRVPAHIERPTVGYAISRYLASDEYKALSPASQADYRYALDRLMNSFGTAPLDEVRPSHIRAYHKARCQTHANWKGSQHRANRELQILGMIFRFARSEELTTNNPKEALRFKKLPGRRHIYIHDDMFDAVYRHGSIALRDAMDLAYYLGQRPSDLLAMSEHNIRDGCLEYRQRKTGMPQRFVIQGPLADLLDAIRRRKTSAKVSSFALLVDEQGRPMTKHKLRYRFELARKAAGFTGNEFQFRDLRRKSGTDVRDQNESLEAAQDLLGHKTQAMSEHYTAARGKKIIRLPTRRKE